jgi:hypothetical protein
MRMAMESPSLQQQAPGVPRASRQFVFGVAWQTVRGHVSSLDMYHHTSVATPSASFVHLVSETMLETMPAPAVVLVSVGTDLGSYCTV